MKTSFKLATGLLLAAVTWVASGTRVMAGEGGVTGSIAINFQTITTGGTSVAAVQTGLGTYLLQDPVTSFFSIVYSGPVSGSPGALTAILPGTGTTTNKVRSISSSIAVGKNGAASTARANGTDTFTSAIGGGGNLTVTNANQASAGYTLGTEDLDGLGTDQANAFSGGSRSTITVAPDAGGNDTVTVIP